jgi:hypothetical protein
MPSIARCEAALRELDADSRPLALHEGDQRPEAFDLGIVPDTEVELVDQADLLDPGCLDKRQPKTSQRIAAEMHDVEGAAGAAGAAAVMHHRRHHQTVLQRHAADLERLEQQGTCGIDSVGDRI